MTKRLSYTAKGHIGGGYEKQRGFGGAAPEKYFLENVYANMCIIEHFYSKNGSHIASNVFLSDASVCPHDVHYTLVLGQFLFSLASDVSGYNGVID